MRPELAEVRRSDDPDALDMLARRPPARSCPLGGTKTVRPVGRLNGRMAKQRGRRAVIQLLGAGGAAGLAGCLSGLDLDAGDDGGDDGGIPTVEVTGEDHEMEDAGYSFTVHYATETKSTLSGSYDNRRPSDGAKFVLFESRVTVRSARSDRLLIPQDLLGLEAGDELYEPEPLTGLPSIESELRPPGNYEAWAVFEVPEDLETATLVAVNPGLWFSLPTEVIFEADSSIPASI